MRFRLTLVALATALLGAPALAQENTVFRGVVREAVTNKPLIGAIVILDVGRFERSTRTDETGAFLFGSVRPGEHLVSVKWLGYREDQRSVDVHAKAAPTVITMTRIQALDTVRVRAAEQAIYGVVATKDLVPIKGAEVQIVGNRALTLTDSNGRFFVEMRRPGSYVIRASASKYQSYTQSFSVNPKQGVEVALLLEPGGSQALDAAFADFTTRMMRRGATSAMVTRAELMRDTTKTTLFEASRSSSPLTKAGLRFADTVCVFVDGRPAVGASIFTFDAQDVEAVEYYTKSAERTSTLVQSWPNNVRCSYTGLLGDTRNQRATFNVTPSRGRRMRLTNDLIYWVVIWLKH